MIRRAVGIMTSLEDARDSEVAAIQLVQATENASIITENPQRIDEGEMMTIITLKKQSDGEVMIGGRDTDLL